MMSSVHLSNEIIGDWGMKIKHSLINYSRFIVSACYNSKLMEYNVNGNLHGMMLTFRKHKTVSRL